LESGECCVVEMRQNVEGLGIAVLIVVGFYCGIPRLSGGFVGVDVFLVLSGYLITRLLVAEIQKASALVCYTSTLAVRAACCQYPLWPCRLPW